VKWQKGEREDARDSIAIQVGGSRLFGVPQLATTCMRVTATCFFLVEVEVAVVVGAVVFGVCDVATVRAPRHQPGSR